MHPPHVVVGVVSVIVTNDGKTTANLDVMLVQIIEDIIRHNVIAHDNSSAAKLEQMCQMRNCAPAHGIAPLNKTVLDRKPVIFHCIAICREPLYCCGKPGKTGNIADFGMPFLNQRLNSAVNSIIVLDHDRITQTALQRAVDKHNWKGRRDVLRKFRIILHRACDDQTVYNAAGERPQVVGFPLFGLFGIYNNQPEPLACNNAL